MAGRLPGSMAWRDAPREVLAYRRGLLTVACNFAGRPIALGARGRLLIGSDPLVQLRAGRLHLPPDSAAWLAERL